MILYMDIYCIKHSLGSKVDYNILVSDSMMRRSKLFTYMIITYLVISYLIITAKVEFVAFATCFYRGLYYTRDAM